ncbi:protein kinase [Streptomyces sp. NPDC087538]|uniref:serine/threonine-protein kinase n=1 Tax=Streptomyces sp. NPDC087538 TaxID=3365797 RepID=UPI00382A7684
MPRLALHSEFRYIHEPLPIDDPAIPVLGHEDLVAGLRRRLTYSHGGTFLITGFRGVGKSTLVMRALAEAAGTRPAGDVLLPVHLNVARRMEADQRLFAVVRRVFESLEDHGLLDRLPDVQNALILAYMRTSLSFKQTHSEGTERGGTVGMAPRQSLVASFRREARIGMRVRHRHVARTVNVVEEPELALVMELVEGPTLGNVLEDGGPLSADRTVGIARQLGAALMHLASLGLSRIDLKPSNVILHPQRGAVVVDLGVAHVLESGEERTAITMAGMVIGAPGYMSPEQVVGDRPDTRSDIFTLGLLLRECLMGRSPYNQTSMMARLIAMAQARETGSA